MDAAQLLTSILETQGMRAEIHTFPRVQHPPRRETTWAFTAEYDFSQPLKVPYLVFIVRQKSDDDMDTDPFERRFYLEQHFAFFNSEPIRRLIQHPPTPIQSEKEEEDEIIVDANIDAFQLFMEMLKTPFHIFERLRSDAHTISRSPTFKEALELAHKYEVKQVMFTAENILLELYLSEVNIDLMQMVDKYGMERLMDKWMGKIFESIAKDCTNTHNPITRKRKDVPRDENRLDLDQMSGLMLRKLVVYSVMYRVMSTGTNSGILM